MANLAPAWQPGESGNRNGRPTIGMSYQEWLNALDTHDSNGVAKYDQTELEQIRDDPKQCRAKRAAAADLLDMARTDYDKAMPLRANVIDRICDRTVGKPVQAIHVHRTEHRVPDAIGADVVAMLAAEPGLLAQALAIMPPAERVKVLAVQPVDTTAEVLAGMEPAARAVAPDAPDSPIDQ